MEILAVVLIIASAVLPVVLVIAVVFFAGFLTYTLIAEHNERTSDPEPEPIVTAVHRDIRSAA